VTEAPSVAPLDGVRVLAVEQMIAAPWATPTTSSATSWGSRTTRSHRYAPTASSADRQETTVPETGADHYGFQTLQTTLTDRVLRVAFNRPDRLNALNALMHEELRDLFGRIERDTDVDVVVLTGNGTAFCVGADFDQMEENLKRGGYPDGHPSLLGDAAAMARNILAVRQPMIAAINGDAIGLGATLALFCDVTFMAEGARIGDPHVRAGIVAGDGGPVLWPMLVGANRAKEYLMTGDLLRAEEAERIGLVNHVVAPGGVEAAVAKMAA
jgi:enoyl-CoA hydratase